MNGQMNLTLRYIYIENKVIPGWQEVLAAMVTGDKWEVYIPPNMGYSASGAPGVIPPYSVLIFEIELLAVSKDKVVEGSEL